MMSSHNTTVADKHTCFSASCKASVRWGIASSVATKNPDGSPLTLFACDEHEPQLTTRLRSAGTRYQLFPVKGLDPSLGWIKPVALPPLKPETPPPEEQFVAEVQNGSRLKRILVNAMLVVVGVVITPFIVVYYGVKWMCGWRPKKDE